VDEHLPCLRSRTRQYLGHVKVVNPGQNASTTVQDLGGAAGVQQVLAMRSVHEAERQLRASRSARSLPSARSVQKWRNRQPSLQPPEDCAFKLPADLGVRPGIPLDDDFSVAGRVIGVPMRKRLHERSPGRLDE